MEDVAAFRATLNDDFFLRNTNGKKFCVFDRQRIVVIFLKSADVCIPETPPPHVCKRLQLGTPSPPRNCGRPLWTAPKR